MDNPSGGNSALALAAGLAAAVAFAISLYQGPPQSLPAVALGWPLILYLERAAFVTLVLLGVGGILYRLLTGAQIKGTGGGPLPSVDVEDITKPTEALKEGVDEDIQDLNDRLYSVEDRLEKLQPPASQTDRDE